MVMMGGLWLKIWWEGGGLLCGLLGLWWWFVCR